DARRPAQGQRHRGPGGRHAAERGDEPAVDGGAADAGSSSHRQGTQGPGRGGGGGDTEHLHAAAGRRRPGGNQRGTGGGGGERSKDRGVGDRSVGKMNINAHLKGAKQ